MEISLDPDPDRDGMTWVELVVETVVYLAITVVAGICTIILLAILAFLCALGAVFLLALAEILVSIVPQ